MISNHIGEHHEIFEILNAFPFLYDTFENMNIPINRPLEGITIREYLIVQRFSEEECTQIVKKLNREVHLFLKKAEKSTDEDVVDQRIFIDIS